MKKFFELIVAMLIWATLLQACADKPADAKKPAGTELFSPEKVEKRQSPVADSMLSEEKDSSHLPRYFRATGTEPFWSLEIDFTKSISFKDVEGIEQVVPAGRGEKAMDANVVRYAAQNDKVSIVVQIAKWPCTNDMSGQKFEYTAMIDVESKPKGPLRSYKGCGRYLDKDSLSSPVAN